LDANVSDKERELANTRAQLIAVKAELVASYRENKALIDEIAILRNQRSSGDQNIQMSSEAIRAHEESVKWKVIKQNSSYIYE
jgi:regulator of replication initiation timing